MRQRYLYLTDVCYSCTGWVIRNMDVKLKQAVTKLQTKEGCPPKDIHIQLKKVHGDAVVDISNVQHWMKKPKLQINQWVAVCSHQSLMRTQHTDSLCGLSSIRKRPQKDIHAIQINPDNAKPHTTFVTTQAIAQIGWSEVPRLPYSPDLARSDLHYLGLWRTVQPWLREQPPFFQTGFHAWVQQWYMCDDSNGD